MLTATQTETGAKNIAKVSKAAAQELPHRIIGVVNVKGFQIVDASTNNTLKTSGNNPTTSDPTKNLPAGQGLDVETMKAWCTLEGEAIAAEHGADWRGVREGEFV